MDYDAIDKRLTEIEEIIGIDDFGKKKSIPSELDELKRKLKNDFNANLLMSVPYEKLTSLNKIVTEPSIDSGSLAEAIESVTFSEALINQRVELMKQYEECLEKVLDTGCLSNISELQPELDIEIRLCEELLEKWKSERAQFLKFREEYSTIIQRISERVLEVQKKISNKTKDSEKSED